MSNFAVFVPSAPPPPPVSTQQGQANCTYSAKVAGTRDDPVFQCFTQEQWDARNAQIAQTTAQQSAQFKHDMHQFFTHSVWILLFWVVIGLIGLVITVGIADSIGGRIHKKRNPDHYDTNGNHKKGFGYWGDKYAPDNFNEFRGY